MRRSRRTEGAPGRWAGRSLLTALVAVAALLSAPAAAQAAGLTPTIACYQANSDGTVSVLLGYENSSGVTQTVPLGPDNVIYPSRLDGLQPTTFDPGSHPGAFAVTLPAGEAWGANWWLDGAAVTSGSSASECPPGTSLPADGNGTGMTIALLVAGAIAALALWRSRRDDRALPA